MLGQVRAGMGGLLQDCSVANRTWNLVRIALRSFEYMYIKHAMPLRVGQNLFTPNTSLTDFVVLYSSEIAFLELHSVEVRSFMLVVIYLKL